MVPKSVEDQMIDAINKEPERVKPGQAAPQVEMVSELPELPKPRRRANDGYGWCHDPDYYTADQMRAYAQAALNARAGGDAKDAKRYRFLRNDPPSSLCVRIDREGCKAIYTDGEILDAAIDAALASQAVGVSGE